MEYIEKMKEHIQQNWFENHVANLKAEGSIRILTFSLPGSLMYRMKYVFVDKHIIVTGNIGGEMGEAVYTFPTAVSLEDIKRFVLHYFTNKLTAFSEPRWHFDSKQARQELDQYWNEHQISISKRNDSDNIYEEVVCAIEESGSIETYHTMLHHIYKTTSLNFDLLEVFQQFGKQIPSRLIAYWLGLQLAIVQLEEKGVDITK